jgi:cell division septum initiation protein DivIVA
VADQDLLALLDELEGFLSESARVPLFGKLLVDEQEVFEIVDRLRNSIPEALHQAQRLNRERDRLLQQAREEGEAFISESKAYAEKLTRDSAIAQRAQEEADRLVEEARRVSREIRLGAREFADEMMSQLETNIQKVLSFIRAGREELGSVQAAAATEAAPAADARHEPAPPVGRHEPPRAGPEAPARPPR